MSNGSTSKETRDTVFLCYAHANEDWLERVRKSLATLEHQGKLIWHDREIQPGANWEAEILAMLQRTKAAILPISRAFLESSFIQKTELPLILERAERGLLTVLWFALERGNYDDKGFAKFQALVDPAKPLQEMSPLEQVNALEHIAAKAGEAVRGRRVLVVGSNREGRAPEEFNAACRSIGKNLARGGFTIVCGSQREVSADHHVLSGANETGATVLRIGTPTGLRDLEDWSQKWPRLDFKDLFESEALTWAEARPRQVSQADVVVLLGGQYGTMDVAYEAAWQGKPVIPTAALGGTAEKWFRPLSRRLIRMGFDERNVARLQQGDCVDAVRSILNRFVSPPS
jgi:predicted Rossmann-fold nucleotide-binding protein